MKKTFELKISFSEFHSLLLINFVIQIKNVIFLDIEKHVINFL